MYSSQLVVNLIANYCKFGKEYALNVDAMTACVQGQQMC